MSLWLPLRVNSSKVSSSLVPPLLGMHPSSYLPSPHYSSPPLKLSVIMPIFRINHPYTPWAASKVKKPAHSAGGEK